MLADPSVSLRGLHRLFQNLPDADSLPGHMALEVFHEPFLQVRVSEHLVTTSGGNFEWHYCDPGKLLQYMIDKCPRLMYLYCEAANEHRGVWEVVITFDEFVPGDKLKGNNYRKSMNLCFTFLQLGVRALQLPITWLLPVCVRSCMIRDIPGGRGVNTCILHHGIPSRLDIP